MSDDHDPTSPDSPISAARPEYKIRSSSLARIPAAVNRQQNGCESTTIEPPKLPPRMMSDVFEVPHGTPQPIIPPLTRNSPKVKKSVVSPINLTSISDNIPKVVHQRRISKVATQPPPTPPASVKIDSVKDERHPIPQQISSTKTLDRQHSSDWIPKTTTVRIDPPSTSSAWFNSEKPTVVGSSSSLSGNKAESTPRRRYIAPPLPSVRNPNYPSSKRQVVPVAVPLVNAPSPMRVPHLQDYRYAYPSSSYQSHDYKSVGGYHHVVPNNQPHPPTANPYYRPYQEESRPPPPIDYSHYPPEVKVDIRKKFYDKFLILQRSFPDWNIPLPSYDSPLENVHSLYESYVKQISIHSSLTQYKICMVILFVVIQLSASRFGIDFEGYAEHQIRGMGKYEGVLIELGEKYSQGGGGEWPVEMKLLMIAITQAVVFFIPKYVEKFTGSSGISSMIHKALDTFIDNLPMSASTETRKVDAQGIPIAPGTEDAISAIDEIVSSNNDSNNNEPRSSLPPRKPAPTTADIGSMLGGLFGGGGNGGGVDMAGLVGSALKFVNGMNASSSGKPTPTAPTIPSVPSGKMGSNGSSPNQPPLSASRRNSPPRSKPRSAPVFTS